MPLGGFYGERQDMFRFGPRSRYKVNDIPCSKYGKEVIELINQKMNLLESNPTGPLSGKVSERRRHCGGAAAAASVIPAAADNTTRELFGVLSNFLNNPIAFQPESESKYEYEVRPELGGAVESESELEEQEERTGSEYLSDSENRVDAGMRCSSSDDDESDSYFSLITDDKVGQCSKLLLDPKGSFEERKALANNIKFYLNADNLRIMKREVSPSLVTDYNECYRIMKEHIQKLSSGLRTLFNKEPIGFIANKQIFDILYL